MRLTSPRPARSLRGGARAGVTLIELLIVVIMIGILSGIAFSRLDWGRYRADSVSRGVVAELAVAQRLAVTLQANVRVTVEAARLVIHEDANNDNLVNTGERVRSIPLEYEYVFDQSTADDVPSPEDPTALTTLVFRRDGSASRNGTIYLSGPGNDTACRHCRAVAVTRATGRVSWYSYATGNWKGGR